MTVKNESARRAEGVSEESGRMLTTFFATAAQLCFTLLGLWRLALQTNWACWPWRWIPVWRRS